MPEGSTMQLESFRKHGRMMLAEGAEIGSETGSMWSTITEIIWNRLAHINQVHCDKMAAISGIKLTPYEEPKGPAGAGTGTGDPGNDPWYGPKKIPSRPDSTEDYQSSVAPSSDKYDVSIAIAKHKRGDVKLQSRSKEPGKINLRTGIDDSGKVGARNIVTCDLWIYLTDFIIILSFFLVLTYTCHSQSQTHCQNGLQTDVPEELCVLCSSACLCAWIHPYNVT